MKKITFLLAFFVSALSFAQSTCATAATLNTSGTNTVTAYGTEVAVSCSGNGNGTGTAWFVYTAPSTGILNLNSDLPANNNTDTRVNVYTGSCGIATLVCAGGGDDVSYPANLATNVDISMTAGTTYYIGWDNRWSPTVPFDFTATFTSTATPPNPVTMPTPVDMAVNVAIDANNTNAVALAWTPDSSGTPAGEYDILFGTDPTMLNNLTANATFTATSVNITNCQYSTLYYWQIVAINGAGSSMNNPIWSFTTESPSGTPPTNATTPTPTDGETMVVIDPTDINMDGMPDDSVTVSWVQDPNGQQPNAYSIRLGDSPTNLTTLTNTFQQTAARFVNQTPGTTYYWQVVPLNNGVEALNQPVWSYTTEGTSSVEDNAVKFFTVSPNPASSIINVNTEEVIESIKIYNALGQQMIENINPSLNQINISRLSSGVYFLTATSIKGAQTVQIIKK